MDEDNHQHARSASLAVSGSEFATIFARFCTSFHSESLSSRVSGFLEQGQSNSPPILAYVVPMAHCVLHQVSSVPLYLS